MAVRLIHISCCCFFVLLFGEVAYSTAVPQRIIHISKFQICIRIPLFSPSGNIVGSANFFASPWPSSMVTNPWRLTLFFSRDRNGSGPRRIVEQNILRGEAESGQVFGGRRFRLHGEKDLNYTTLGLPGEYPYLCLEFGKVEYSYPNFELRTRYRRLICVIFARFSSVLDETLRLDWPIISEDESILRKVEVVSTFTTPVQLYVNEANNVTTDVEVQTNILYPIEGTDFWQMAVWFSQNRDGSGRVRIRQEEVLNSKQRNKRVALDKNLKFEGLPAFVDLTDGLGCNNYRYICTEIRKFNPSIDITLRETYEFSRRGCVQVTCGDRSAETPVVQFRSTQPTPITLYLREKNEVTTNVTVQFEESVTDSTVAGENLWQMDLWFSRASDGQGSSTGFLKSVLTEAQRAKPVDFEDFVMEELAIMAEPFSSQSCESYKYICARVRKDSPTPDYKLMSNDPVSTTGCAPVTCQWRRHLYMVSTNIKPVTLYTHTRNEVTTNITVKFSGSLTVTGRNNWEVSLWYSKLPKKTVEKIDLNRTALSRSQRNQPRNVREPLVFENVPSVVDLTENRKCGKYRYICAEIRKSDPRPNFTYNLWRDGSKRACAKITCIVTKVGIPTVQFKSVQPTPATLYVGQENEVTTDVRIEFDEDNTDESINGTNLWELAMWFSKYEDGAGSSVGMREETLSQVQKDQPVNFDHFEFTGVEMSADLTHAFGCGKYRYICARIRKNNPQPDYNQIGKNPIKTTGCAPVTCEVGDMEIPTVQFKSVQPTPVTLYVGQENEVTTDVRIEFNEDNTDESIAGTSLWELAMWFSKYEDGVGSSIGMKEDTLNQAQQDQPVNFDHFEFTGVGISADLTNSIGCGKYRYICVRIRKNDPEPEYEQIGKNSMATTGCAPVTCEVSEQQDPLVIVSTVITPVTLYIGEENMVYPDVTVEFEGEEIVSGTNLWEVEIFFNKYGDGSGAKVDQQANTLTRSQRDQPLLITEPFIFEDVKTYLDLTEAEGCGNYKYICAEIRKDNPSPPFEFGKRRPSSIRGCAKTSCGVRGEREPTVQFASTQPSPVTIYEEEMNVVHTDVVVTFNEANTDLYVEGVNLWQMTLWFSKAANGTGSSIGLIESVLSEDQSNKPITFSNFVFEDLEIRADLASRGCDKFRYICARVRRYKPDPSYEIIGEDLVSIRTGCAPVDCQRVRQPTAQFASVRPTGVTVYADSQTTVETTVAVTFNEKMTDEDVSGTSLWQVNLWFSKYETGRGSSYGAVESVLSASQASKSVNASNFVFKDLEIIADLTSNGCGKFKYICARIRRDYPEPSYQLMQKDTTSYYGCAEVQCENFDVPVVEFASVLPTGVTIYEGEENRVTTTVTVTFNENTTDPYVSGTNLWQMILFFSKAPDGIGSEIYAVYSALSTAQGAKPVDFSNMTFEDLEITANLIANGCGKFRYICARIRRDDPEPSYRLVRKNMTTSCGCAEVQCESLAIPVVEFASVQLTGVTIYEGRENRVTTTVTVTFNENTTDPSVSGTNLWQMILFFSKAPDGIGSEIDAVYSALSAVQGAKPIDFSNMTFEDLEITANLTANGCGKFRYICARIRRDDPEPSYRLVRKNMTTSCGCAEVQCESSVVPVVEFASVLPTGVTIFQGRENRVTTAVTVTFNENTTDPFVSGTNLWQLTLFFSKAPDGVGSEINAVYSALSTAQGAKPVDFSNMVFEDLEIIADLTTTGCGKFRYICARMRRDNPDPSYQLVAGDATTTSGCAEVLCERARPSTVTVTSVAITPVSIVTDKDNQVTTDVTVAFDRESDQISGSNLWRIEVWYSKSNTGSGYRKSLTAQALSAVQQNQGLDGSFTLLFTGVIANADLRESGCGKYQFVCARIKKGEANPDFELQDLGPGSVTGCSPVQCGD